MSIAATSWVFTQDLKPAQMMVLFSIADEATSDGVCHTGRDKIAWKANCSTKTVQRHLRELEVMELLHIERRYPEWARGRMTDAIVLHLDHAGAKGEYPGQAQIRKQQKEDREQYEVSVETIEDVPTRKASDLQDRMSDRPISPSQALEDKLSDRPIYRTVSNDLADIFDPKGSGALIGTRARLTRQSRQSAAVSNSKTDSPASGTDGLMDEKTSPAKVSRGVSLNQLRSRLGHQLAEVSDDLLEAMISIVLDRASGRVKSPMAFVAAGINREPLELRSHAEELLSEDSTSTAADWDDFLANEVGAVSEVKAPSQRRTCPIHQLEYSVDTCPSCRADSLASPADVVAVEGTVDGRAFREKLRRQRGAREGVS